MYSLPTFLFSLLSFVSVKSFSFLSDVYPYPVDLPEPVDELILDNYLGNWFQVYGAPTNVIFQGYGTCITAEYGLFDNGTISVLNSQLNRDGEYETIEGYAYYKNGSNPGQLTVHLQGVPTDSPYWVVKLGEIVDEEYQYSIVTTPSAISLWVLARDLDIFYDLYHEEVTDYLDNFFYRYVEIVQTDC